MGEIPKRNTVIEDIAVFQSERLKFKEDLRQLKYGYSQYAVVVVSGLRSMYVELVYSTHREKNAEAAQKFITEIDALYAEATRLASNPALKDTKNTVRNEQFLSVIKKLDVLHSKLMEYKRECGFG